MSRNQEKQNNIIKEIEVIRSFCIISVISAHLSGTVFSTFTGFPLFMFYCCRAFGTIGVIGFFVISGFLYKNKNERFAKTLLTKVKYIIIPSLIAAIINYLAIHINNFSFSELIAFCYGGGSLFYYITVLIICFIFFHYFMDNNTALYLAIIINIISIILFATDVIQYDQLPYPYITSYLIPTNWIGFFALGILLRKKNCFWKIIDWSSRYIILLLVSFAVITALYAYFSAQTEISYFVFQSIPYELFGFVVFMGASKKLKEVVLFRKIGSASFFIFLYHINIIGVISNKLCFKWYIVLFYPIIVALLLLLINMLIQNIASKINLGKWLFVLGIKEK